MKVELQYLNDAEGNTQAVQLSLTEWRKVLNKLKKYEQALHLQKDLKEAFSQVESMRKSKAKKQTLNDFLNEL